MTTASTDTSATVAGGRKVVGPAPEWAVERAVKWVGNGSGAVGRGLDRLAKMPGIGAVVGLFSSVWFGIIILGLIGAYIAVGSGFAKVRAALEMTDLQFFDAWPMRLLLLLLVLDLSIVTLRRIPLTLFKLGSWTVHVGILTLVTGCVWYFGWKQEGSVRIYLGKTVDACYDVTERALYAFKMNDKGEVVKGAEGEAMTALPGLPIYYEHLAEQGNGLSMEVPGALAGLEPTLKDVGVKVVGYYPCAVMQPQGWRAGKPGEEGKGAGLAFQLTSKQGTLPESWLIAATPAGRLLEGEDLPMGFEYLKEPTAERLRELQASFDGPLGVTVRVPAKGAEKTYAVKPGQEIAVEGTDYAITPLSVNRMPMASKGYERTSSTAMTFGVKRKDADGKLFEFERMSLFRYPERSPDFVMENGQKKRKQDGVDKNVQIIFHDASQPQVWFVETGGRLLVIVRDVTGKSVTKEVKEGDLVDLGLAQFPGLAVRLTERTANAVAEFAPMVIPVNQRPRGQTAMEVMQLSIAEVELSRGEWKQHAYVPFSAYAAVGERPVGEHPTEVDVPGYGKVGLLMSTVKRPMPSAVQLANFEAVKQKGAVRAYADYVSTLKVRPVGGGEEKTVVARLNSPAVDRGIYYFQAAWDGDDNALPEKRFTVLGVANRPGVWVMTLGAILIISGIGYAFYVKPVLLKMKKEQVQRWAEGQA